MTVYSKHWLKSFFKKKKKEKISYLQLTAYTVKHHNKRSLDTVIKACFQGFWNKRVAASNIYGAPAS